MRNDESASLSFFDTIQWSLSKQVRICLIFLQTGQTTEYRYGWDISWYYNRTRRFIDEGDSIWWVRRKIISENFFILKTNLRTLLRRAFPSRLHRSCDFSQRSCVADGLFRHRIRSFTSTYAKKTSSLQTRREKEETIIRSYQAFSLSVDLITYSCH